MLLDLSGDMSVLATSPGVTGTDTEYFNSNLRRWYTASSNNTNGGVQCPADSTGAFPVIGVFAASGQKKTASIVGAECSGRNGHSIGVDPIDNQIYTGVRQFPADTGNPGVVVFHDPANLAQPDLTNQASANLASLSGQQGSGKVLILDNHILRARLTGLPSGKSALLNVTTTVGNEVVACDISGSNASCAGLLTGEALINGVILLSTDGTPAAKGNIVPGNGGFGKFELSD